MKNTKVLTLSSVCKQNYCKNTFSIVNFILIYLANIVNIFINIASYDMNALIIFQGRPHVFIIDLHAHFHSDSALYPDSNFQSDSGLSQCGTDSGLHPHSCLHPDSGF